MERKYIFEAGLDVFTSYKTLIPVESLEELSKWDMHRYHIYGILSYNKIFFRKEKTIVTPKGIKVSLFVVSNGEEKEYDLPLLEVARDLDYSKVSIAMSYPYTFFTLTINDLNFLESHPEVESTQITINAQMLFNMFSYMLVEKQEFEVLYIGQAYGKEGSRTAFDRLASHSTLQRILIDYQSEHPDKQIYILLLEFTPNLAMSFDGLSKQYTKSEAESDQHMKDVICNLPKDEQIINITEAALINYFKPEYNVNFVENFPDEQHKGYRQYFDLDYNTLVVEVDMEFDNASQIQLYTETNRINSCYDYIRYNLYNDNNRLNMYEIFKRAD